ncbi:MAG: hypothetical protein QGG67_21475 [Gammaproteobacteria bacterium]|jgi:hypothetical protein|nr:hypothetical protein [Gammaproteobacteria bacterium]MDP6098515.1 hypothetical protein [Gammaproteobacteria bacterium]HJO10433.1 hypothetical protein [Gammaproteobacteria bacterium]|tara:strand:- start:70 stop:444 length:375 start_codon:yes stop_codon:yes gene_type:complete
MSKNSRPFTASNIKVLVLLVVVLLGMTFAANLLITSSENQDFLDRYGQIELGIPESAVLSLLGTPNERSSEFYLGQREEFEEAYERAAGSGATRYLMWHRDSDVVYTVGFNEEGNVAIVEAGGP